MSEDLFEEVKQKLNEYVLDFEICETVNGESIDCDRQKSLDYVTNVIINIMQNTSEINNIGSE